MIKKLILLKSVVIIISCAFLNACDMSEPEYFSVEPMPVINIEEIENDGLTLRVKINVFAPTPCWYYHRTEESNDGNIYSAKIFARYNGEICIQVTSSFIHEEEINFKTAGEKTLKFWVNSSTYIDTVLIIN